MVPIPVIGEEGERKRKRGRKPKFVTEKKLAMALASAEEGGKDEGLLNKNGAVVDLEKLAKMEDPYGPELERRTEGRVKPEELLGFISELKGQWGSRRRKRKIVDANEFGDALPNGWKVLIAMKKRAGQAWVFCRRYVRFYYLLLFFSVFFCHSVLCFVDNAGCVNYSSRYNLCYVVNLQKYLMSPLLLKSLF